MEYMTAEDKTRLGSELAERISNRKVISTRIAEARELGDLKENAEWHAGREDQGLNEAKIRLLEEKLANAIITDASDIPEGIVFIGATVRLRDVGNKAESCYRLVGETSGTFDDDVIEVTPNSPLGEALMKARVGETVRVNLRRGPKHFEIVEILS